jgi:hypothetical protein
LHRTLQGIQKKFEKNLSLEKKIALSVKKVVEDLRSPKDCKNRPSSKEIGGRISRDTGVGTPEGFLSQTNIFAKSRRVI